MKLFSILKELDKKRFFSSFELIVLSAVKVSDLWNNGRKILPVGAGSPWFGGGEGYRWCGN
jgi:hypothetical protein